MNLVRALFINKLLKTINLIGSIVLRMVRFLFSICVCLGSSGLVASGVKRIFLSLLIIKKMNHNLNWPSCPSRPRRSPSSWSAPWLRSPRAGTFCSRHRWLAPWRAACRSCRRPWMASTSCRLGLIGPWTDGRSGAWRRRWCSLGWRSTGSWLSRRSDARPPMWTQRMKAWCGCLGHWQ